MQDKYKQAVDRNMAKLEKVEELMREVIDDDVFMAHLAKRFWAVQPTPLGSILEQFENARSFIFDFLWNLESDLEKQEDVA